MTAELDCADRDAWETLVGSFPAVRLHGGPTTPAGPHVFDLTPPPPAGRPLKIVVSGRPGAGKTALLSRFRSGSGADVPARALRAYGPRGAAVDLFREAGRPASTLGGERRDRRGLDTSALAQLAALNVLKAQLSVPTVVAVAAPGLFNYNAWFSLRPPIQSRLAYCLAAEYADMSRRYDLRFVHLRCAPEAARLRAPVTWSEATEPFYDFLGWESARDLAEQHPDEFIALDVSCLSYSATWDALAPRLRRWVSEGKKNLP